MSTKQHIKFLPMALAISLLFSWSVLAGFNRPVGSNTITQSGTDANLSGLASISGVTVTTEGGVTVYNIGTNILVVNGTLEIGKNANEQLVVDGDTGNWGTKITVSGTLIIGDDTLNTASAWYQYNFGLPVLRTTGSVASNPTGYGGNGLSGRRPSLYVSSSGSFQVYGSFVSLYTGFGAVSGAEIIIRNATIYSRDYYIYGTDTEIENSYIIGPFSFLAAYDVWRNVSVQQQIYFNFSSTTPAIDAVVADIPDGNYTLGDYGSTSATPIVRARDAFKGTDYTSLTSGGSNRRYQVLFEKTVNITAQDASKTAIQGVNTFIIGHDFSNAVNNVTNASGTTSDVTVSTGSNINPSNSTTLQTTRNCISQNNTDDWEVRSFHYNYNSNVSNEVFKGNGTLNITHVLTPDASISQTTKATVDAYTQIDNLDQLYDRAKSWKVTTANVNYPTLSTQPITASSTALDLGNRSLEVDANATAAFAIDKTTHTITIKAAALKAGTKFTSITTTGTISTANNATLEFGYTHSGGTQKYLELTGLASADISVMNNQPATAVSLGSATNQTGTYKLSFAAPTDASDIQIEVSRTGYTTWTEQFPENDLSLMRNVLQYQNVPLAAKQVDMINYALRIMQKEEAINAALNGTTPTVTVTTNTTPVDSVATVANQDAILALLKRILVKSAANREALKEQ